MGHTNNQAIEALQSKMPPRKGEVRIFQESDSEESELTMAEVDKRISRLFVHVMSHDWIGIADLTRELYQLVRFKLHPSTAYQFTVHVILKLDMSLSVVNESIFRLLEWDYRSLDILLHYETTDDFEDWMRKSLFELSERLRIQQSHKSSQLIQRVKNYIHKHLERRLTLRDVAEVFAYSPNHLGILFKESAGVCFSDYLHEKRMERADQLLKNSTFNLKEISHRLGYSHLTYFNRRFKEKFGIPPGEYRKRWIAS